MYKKTKCFVLKKSFTKKEAMSLFNILDKAFLENNDICYHCTMECRRNWSFPDCKNCEDHIPSGITDLYHRLQFFLYPPKKYEYNIDDELPF